jgi:O-antigen/teichoic acid export membrane protein
MLSLDMLNSIRVSIRDTFIFGFGNIAVKIIGFVLIPLYTNPKYFSVDDFGIIGLLDISGLVLMSIFASSFPQSLTRWYWAKENTCTQKEISFMSITSQVILSLLFCCLLIPFSGTLSRLIFSNINWSLAISLIILSSALQGINNIINTLLRLQARSSLFMLTNLVKLLIVLLLTIYLIVYREMGIAGIYLAQVIGNSLIILLLIPYTLKNCSTGFDLTTWKSMFAYGVPLVVASLSTVLLNVIDRYTLNSLALLKYVAVYTLAYKISSSLKLVLVDTIKLSVFPQMIRRIDSQENKRFYSKAMLYSSYVVMFGIIGVSLFSLEVIKFLAKTPELWSAYMLVPVLSLSTFFINMREVSIYGLIAAKKTQKISIIVIISTVLNLLLNLLLIPVWNAMGAAMATLISQLFYWSLMHFIAQKAYFIPYENKKIFLIFITGSILSITSLLLNNMDLVPRILIKFLCLAAFPIVLYIFNFYEPIELQSIKGFITKWSNLSKFKDNLKSLRDVRDEV